MTVPFYDMTRVLESEKKELSAIFSSVISSARFAADTEVRMFEEEFKQYQGGEQFIACANGTDALEIAYRSLGLDQGDEVIVPAFTCWATVEPLILMGIKPVYVDVNLNDFGMDPHLIQSAISRNTRAVVISHLFGYPSRVDEIREICEVNGLYLVEDCAHAHGVKYWDRSLGNYGRISAFSFYPTKNLAALGEAGGILTSDTDLAEEVRRLADHGQISKDVHALAGRNSRMDELQAAFLRFRLRKLEERLDEKRNVARRYYNNLRGSATVPVFQQNAGYHQVVILIDDRESVMQQLSELGIGTAIHYPYTIPGIVGESSEGYPVASRLASNILSLPSFPGIREDEVDLVSEAIIGILS